MTEYQCHFCGCTLREFSEDYEGDDITIFMLYDGKGGEGASCSDCWNNKTSSYRKRKATENSNFGGK